MSNELTREQLIDLVRYLDNQAEQLTGSDGVAAQDILKNDAALRARIAKIELINFDHEVGFHAFEQQLAAMKEETERLKAEMGYHEAKDVIEQLSAQLATMTHLKDEALRAWKAVQDQLAAMTQERDALARKYALCKNDPDYVQCCQLRERAEQQLAAMTQERDRLNVPLCIGQPIIDILAETGEYRREHGGGLIAADDLFHHSPYTKLADLTKENERLRNPMEHADYFTPLLIERDAKIADLTAQLDAVTKDRDGWKTQYDACHVLHLEAQAECEEKNTFMLMTRAIGAEQQLTAMTQERDAYIRRVEEEEPIFHDLMRQLASRDVVLLETTQKINELRDQILARDERIKAREARP